MVHLHEIPNYYPVVRRELRSYGYSYSLLKEEPRSYQEFPNHILDIASISTDSSEASQALAFAVADVAETLKATKDPKSMGIGKENHRKTIGKP